MPSYTESAGSYQFLARSGGTPPGFVMGSPITGGGLFTPTQYTEYVNFYNFGFSVPSNEIIVGILVDYTIQCIQTVPFTTQVAADGSVLLWETSGAFPGQTDHAQPGIAYNTSTPTAELRGGSLDSWGANITPAQANDTGFGFSLSTQYISGPSSPFPGPPMVTFDLTINPSVTIYTSTSALPQIISVSSLMNVYPTTPVQGVKVF